MPCFYGNGDDIDANDGGDGNLGLAQVVGVRSRLLRQVKGHGRCDVGW